MPVRRRLIHALAYHHQSGDSYRQPGLPTREMWLDTVPEGIAALDAHPVFQVAPLGDDLRAQMLHPDRQRRICKDVRLAKDGPVEALIWHPIGWPERPDYALARTPEGLYSVYRSKDRDNRFRIYDAWICMTRDRVWRAAGGDRDHMALGSIVHLLERLDASGHRLPPEPAGELPEEDGDALAGLIR